MRYGTKSNKNKDRVSLVLTYGKRLPDIHNIVHRRMDILHKSSKMRKISKAPPLVAFRRGRTIKDVLVHQKWKNQETNFEEREGQRCSGKCKICNITMTGEIKGTSGKTFSINNKVNCKSVGVVYGIHCETCEHVVYVGETGTKLYTRIQNHLSTIRHNRMEQPVGKHFNSKDHTINDCKVIGLEQIRNKDISYRRTREMVWIKKLDTMEPKGLDKQYKNKLQI